GAALAGGRVGPGAAGRTRGGGVRGGGGRTGRGHLGDRRARRPHRRPAHGALRGDRPGRGDGRRPQPDLGGLLGHRGVRDGLAGGARVAGVVAGGGGAAHHGGG